MNVHQGFPISPKEGLKKAAFRFFPSVMEKRYALPIFSEIKRTGIAFIHIPKAAGMSVSQVLYGKQVGHMKWHDLLSCNPLIFDGLLKFSVFRDPEQRFLSAFHFLKAGGINEKDKQFSDDVLHDITGASDLALRMVDPEFRRIVMRKVHFHTQFSFVCRPDGEVMIDHLVDLDRMDRDLAAILPHVFTAGIPVDNRGPKKPASEDALSRAARDVIRDLYACDYALAGCVRGTDPVRGQVVRSLV